jgi:hypothetical protein
MCGCACRGGSLYSASMGKTGSERDDRDLGGEQVDGVGRGARQATGVRLGCVTALFVQVSKVNQGLDPQH